MPLSSRIASAALIALLPASARADWPSSPTTNLPICTATGLQVVPAMTTDMAGGAYIAFYVCAKRAVPATRGDDITRQCRRHPG